jgi:glycosyltransferase involved in cell wall biosynthesis
VPPTIDLRRYLVDQRTRDFVTFINPIAVKGVEVALALARRLPSVRFLFVKGRWAALASEPELPVLPNVEVWSCREDMREVYARTDVLLFPSQWEETAGRVVIEAQLNGIPVVASAVGGVPDQVGEGGILIADRTDVAAFAAALERLRGDQSLYDRLSARAVANTRRPAFDLSSHVDTFVAFVEAELHRSAA